MKKKLLLRLCLILAVALSLYSCTNEDLYSSSENEKKEILSKSPWKEDQVYIKKVQKVFLQNANLQYFERKYGTVHWEYAMSFGNFDESYLVVPVLKGNTVVTAMKVYRIDDRIYFREKNDPEFISFFTDIMFKEISGIDEKVIYNPTSAASKAIEYKCTYRTITVGCFESEPNCNPISRTIRECNWVDTGDSNGPRKMELCDPMTCGGGGGPDPGIVYPDPPEEKDPCEKMKLQNNNTEYKAKIESLDKNSVLSQKKETGYSENKSGIFTELKQSESTDASDGLKVPDSPETKGYIHTHLNDYETGKTDDNGNIEIKKPIRMFSPADVNTLMVLAGHVTDGDYSDLYGTMVSSDGNYTIKFTGTVADIKTGFKGETWRKKYAKYIEKENGTLESKFLRFLKEEMNVQGVELYKIKSNGSIKKKTLNSNNKVQSEDCPQ